MNSIALARRVRRTLQSGVVMMNNSDLFVTVLIGLRCKLSGLDCCRPHRLNPETTTLLLDP